ncbi:hypothetical protein [Hyphomonas oceanitis]|uniref:Lipoprotein n=1 Tax=Hyphomonas oceanitis SCH89 TaxID=1280953 RepID=A0A059G8W7_9PROT|nr:hypothetical protein [Hyphomonas oceanitis]KDA03266.1 hypothetical protein HOC_06508 [Hyphomonas oceanitis SCH89]
MRIQVSLLAFGIWLGACGAPSEIVQPEALESDVSAEISVLGQVAAKDFDCPYYDGIQPIAAVAPSYIIILGEAMHGTNESPEAFYALACHLAERGEPIRIGLEAPHTQSAGLETFLSHPDDTSVLRVGADNSWSSHDGRSSEAMLLLLQRLADLRAKGVDVSVFAFDSDPQETMGAENVSIARDAAMARHVNDAVEGYEGAVLLLTGDFHARKEAFSLGEYDIVPMATGITVRPVLSLNMLHAGGTAWMIGEVDGEPFKGVMTLQNLLPSDALDKAFRLERIRQGYDGVYYTGPITVSRPAFPDASDP